MKIKKGLFSLICAFICASLIISIGAVIYNESLRISVPYSEISKNKIENVIENGGENNSILTQIDPQNVCILKEYNGSIGVFSEQGELLDVINVPVVTLPLSERQQLQKGIKTKSEKELYSLIEDYTG